jgi:hypothetical protein
MVPINLKSCSYCDVQFVLDNTPEDPELPNLPKESLVSELPDIRQEAAAVAMALRNGEINPYYPKFKVEILEKALPALIENVNLNYNVGLCLDDLEILFKPQNKGSFAFGAEKIVFGRIRAQYVVGRRAEYKMFHEDPDLGTHDVLGWKFVAWWLAAHELSHIVKELISRKCHGIPEPIIPHALSVIGPGSEWGRREAVGAHFIGAYPKLEDLLVNQTYWVRTSSGRYNPNRSRDQKTLFSVCLKSRGPMSNHGIFFQHIYRTLRRQVVNPMFDIPVGDWKQKKKPKRRNKKRLKYGAIQYIKHPKPQMYSE